MSSSVVGRALVLGSALFLWTVSVQGQECLDCHDSQGGVHAELSCEECHSNVGEIPHPEEGILDELGGTELCSQCHGAYDELGESVHEGIECTDCHGAAHGIISPSELSSPVSPIRQIETCGECHGDADEDLMAGYLASVHGRALLVKGLVDAAPSCSDCHGAHSIQPVHSPEAPTSWDNAPKMCGACHQTLDTRWETSAHGMAWAEGNREAPVCTTCHGSHEVLSPLAEKARIHSPEICAECHESLYESYRRSFHGKSSDLGFARAAVCSDCHTPHHNLPQDNAESTVNPEMVAATCSQSGCHEGAPASFATIDPHLDPKDPSTNPIVRWIFIFMSYLLIGVFTFFGIHDFLWLQRSVVAMTQGEVKLQEEEGEKWVRRFRRDEMATHATIVVTFLILAGTGLPLHFHYAPWAQAVAAIFGGIDSARVWHRMAAVFTFGYAFFHVAMLLRQTLVKKRTHILWGWASMVPHPGDLRDLFNTLRYFLYMGKRPDYDRFTYWEKFDYFAVFWGIPIIGGSGLVLWLPELFSRIVPGWAIDAAYIVHADEALLATGFIFFFHFFHTHMRPESFPLDPVIFLGKMPLSRFEEERPAEYRRLVDEGRLDQFLEDAPQRYQIRRAYAFGFGALLVGLVLAVGILWAFLMH